MFVAVPPADRLTSPRVIDGALTGDLFVTYVLMVLSAVTSTSTSSCPPSPCRAS